MFDKSKILNQTFGNIMKEEGKVLIFAEIEIKN